MTFFRHVTIVSQEVIDWLNTVYDLGLVPGSLGENVTVRGLGDLSTRSAGETIYLGERVRLRITKQNAPCVILSRIHRLLPKWIAGKRGLLCAIESGVGEYVATGMSVITGEEDVDLF
jgi:MOSC domain-containing protein YiiM